MTPHSVRRRVRTHWSTAITLLLLFCFFWRYGDTSDLGKLPRRSSTENQLRTTLTDSRCERRRQEPEGKATHLIPHKIWQIWPPEKNASNIPDTKKLEHTSSWLALNTDYMYTLIGQKGGQELVESYFANAADLTKTYNALPNVGMKSDLLRYLVLGAEGGVYSDLDTAPLEPVDEWVPLGLRDKVRLVVGIEFDRRSGVEWADISHWVQFCQWTIAAAPCHPVFEKMVARVLHSVKSLSEKYEVPIDQLQPTSFEVLNSTGPAAWTDIVFEQLQEHDPSLNETRDLSFMSAPRLYGDILVLPVDAFGMGQSHSHSTHDGTIPDAALVRHFFRGGWRGG